MRVPDDIHDHVLGLAVELVDASANGATREHWRHYEQLRHYCEAQAESGRDHPFLWETLADFTTDDRIAIELYVRALGLARLHEAHGYEASIHIALAQRHADRGSTAIAMDHAWQADELARQLDDLELRRSISQFLLDHSGRAEG